MAPPRPRRLAARLRAVTLAVAVATPAVLVPAASHGQAAPPEAPDFAAVLTADARVTPAIKGALADGRAVARAAAFGDLTADGTSDAVVLVTTPGAAGAVAAYVLSADGADGGALRVVHRTQRLYRGAVRVADGALVVLTAAYVRGDDVCCPAARLQRTYRFDRGARAFRRTATRRLPRSPS